MSTQLTPAQLNYAQPEQWRQLIKQELTDLRCATPAFLAEDLDPAKQTVTVQIALQERVRTPTGPQWWDVPPIINVPIVLPRGGGFSLTLPLKKGDEGLLTFCDTCFDYWWVNGKNNAPVAANTGQASGSQRQLECRRHHVHDCGFTPGMWSQPNVLTNYSTTATQLRSDDGSTLVEVANGKVTVVAAEVDVINTGGTPLSLMNDTFLQWYTTNIQPFLISKGYAGPGVPAASKTSILKGQ